MLLHDESPTAVEERENAFLVKTYARTPFHPRDGKGARLFDADGRAYWDLLGGIAVNVLGHKHPKLLKTLKIVVSVLGGTVNKMLVSELTKLGVRAAGISGSDATLVATQHPPIDGVELGHVGRVTGANCTLVKAMLQYGILPVVSSIAQSEDGALLNVNADSAAAALAVALQAKSLRFITDVAGFLDASGAVVPVLRANEAETFLESVTGGMKPKLQAALSALRAGVGAIEIGENGGTHLVAA